MALQASTVFVSSRSAAQRVIEHYTSTRIGLVHCKIVDETNSRYWQMPGPCFISQQYASSPEECAEIGLCFVQAGAPTTRRIAASNNIHLQQDRRHTGTEAAARDAGELDSGTRPQRYELRFGCTYV
jgi:hypothetical protein